MKITELTTIKAKLSEFVEIPQYIFQRQSNGSWIYIFGFEETERPLFHDVENTNTYKAFLGYVVKLSGETSLNNFKQQLMEYFWGVDKENQYINEYNIAMNNLVDSDLCLKYINTYTQFLKERIFVLDKLENDFNQYILK